MKKILALVALILIVVYLTGCGGPKLAPEAPAEKVVGESEISEDVSEVDTLDTELEDPEAETELDTIGDPFSDW